MSTNGKFVVIDGNELSFEDGETLLEVAARAGIEIPTLCYDPRLSPAGACRMCLVEVEGSRLMQPACSLEAAPGTVARTNTPKVDRNRRFLLSLHLADTIQDRETAEDNNPSRLHDLAEQYGTAGAWRPVDRRRQGRPSDTNPFIEFRPDRCIACSLCTRYCDQVEAVSAITLAGRGADTTISTADGIALTDSTCELCGGCVDVCPTGAMTEKPALAWGKAERELEKVRTTCNFCGVGCQLDLNVDREANRVVKVTSPPPGTTVNDGNLCVKGRFANDFIHHDERLKVPLVRDEEGNFREATWDEALDRAVAGLQGVAERHGDDALAFVSSSRCTGEENYLVQKMARAAFRTHNVHQCAAT
ncbi:MAG: molybdopterin-dependent oxidoreductase [bacterium]|nr:molybdopterin-dependent oxidoreductase [bacterium]